MNNDIVPLSTVMSHFSIKEKDILLLGLCVGPCIHRIWGFQNYDRNFCVAVFKVFSIEEDEFVENCNLRVGKNLNLNFSCNDVAWNTIEGTLPSM
jgi:hypothetical protein